MLPHHENECEGSVNNFWFSILSNHGITRIYEFMSELLTASIGKNSTYYRKNMDSKIINFTHCKTCKKRLLAVEYVILIRYYHQTANTRALYECTDGPAGWPTDNPPTSDGLGDFHRSVPELTVWVNWQPGLLGCKQFGFDPDPYPNWRSGTVANTSSG